MKASVFLFTILIAFSSCSDKEKKNEIFLLGLLGLSSSQSPPEPTNAAGSTVVVNDPGITMPDIEIEQPTTINPNEPISTIQQPINVNPTNEVTAIQQPVITTDPNDKIIFPLGGFTFISSYLFNYKKIYSEDFDKLIPPEGSAFRRIGMVTHPVIDCSSVRPVPDNPEYNGEHIQNITIWKKNNSGNWEFYPGEFICNIGYSTPPFYNGGYYWERKGFPVTKKYDRDFSSLEKANENWLDPNSSYRILYSKRLKDTRGRFISDFQFHYLRLGGAGEDSNYLWFDFKTMQSSCIKTYYDLTGQIYDYYGLYDNYENSPNPTARTGNYSYTPSNVIGAKYYNISSNEIKVTGPALIKKKRSELCNSVPELCVADTTYYPYQVTELDRLDTHSEESMQYSPLMGICIKNPGKENEYVVGYFKGYNFDLAKIKSQCSGIWRNHGTPLPMYDFTQTRCPSNGSGNEEAPTAVCKKASGILDLTQGRWFLTPQEEIVDPNIPNKKITVKGIHTFWANQKLVYKIKGNCKAGRYNLKITAKNIYGPLPKNYSTFKLQIKNTKDNKVYKLEINASDIVYKSATLQLFIAKGDSDLEIIWTNDEYKKEVHDANIQIKSTILNFVSEQ